jgi:hypothetical protein
VTNSKPSYVFPGEGVDRYLNDSKKAFDRMRKRMEIENIKMHDLHRTLGSQHGNYRSKLAHNWEGIKIIKAKISTAIYVPLSQEPVRDAMTTAVQMIKGLKDQKAV